MEKHYQKMTHPDADGDKEFFKTINRAYQILTNNAAREAYNIFGLDKAGKVMNDKNWSFKFPYETTIFLVVRRSYKKICEKKYCLIFEWVVNFILVKRGAVWVSHVYKKRYTENLGFQG